MLAVSLLFGCGTHLPLRIAACVRNCICEWHGGLCSQLHMRMGTTARGPSRYCSGAGGGGAGRTHMHFPIWPSQVTHMHPVLLVRRYTCVAVHGVVAPRVAALPGGHPRRSNTAAAIAGCAAVAALRRVLQFALGAFAVSAASSMFDTYHEFMPIHYYPICYVTYVFCCALRLHALQVRSVVLLFRARAHDLLGALRTK